MIIMIVCVVVIMVCVHCRRHGWRVFYRGLGVMLLRSIPVSSTVLPLYDAIREGLMRRAG